MILKIGSDNNGWCYYDNVLEVVIDPKVKYRSTKYNENAENYPFGWEFRRSFDDDKLSISYHPDDTHITRSAMQGEGEFTVGICKVAEYIRKGDNIKSCVSFDTPAFLLNDEGKTIERL